MKIGFVILKIGCFPSSVPIDIVYDWQSIKNWDGKKDEYITTPSRDWYALIKALANNPLFVSEIKKARKNCGLPENGLPIDIEKYCEEGWNWRYQKLKTKIVKGVILSIDDGPVDLQTEQVLVETKRIMGAFILPIADDYLRDIIKHGFVDPVPVNSKSITFYSDGPGDEIYHVYIKINQQFSKNAFQLYIENNWKEIEKRLNRLPKILPENFSDISDRDFEIFELKDQKHTFREIAEIVGSKYGQDMITDTVKTAHKRAKDKILDLFKSKRIDPKSNSK